MRIARRLIALMLLTLPLAVQAEAESKNCLSCHDPSLSHSMKHMMNSAHWDKSKSNAPVSQQGCVSCHGDSVNHANTPTRIQPTVSFGPRWTGSVDQQNDTCLNCHEETATHNQWRQGVHAQQQVTCVTCHDVHSEQDLVANHSQQIEVCSVCHKTQKDGIHNLTDKLADNPGCTHCHNPHANPDPVVMMLANRSEGCRSCHDLQKLQDDPAVTAKAKSYHRVMANEDRTCVDCHRGVAHVDQHNFGALLAGGLQSAPLELFYPGQSDGDWLLAEHQGAQALRQGRNCRQCHIGEGDSMGRSLAPAGVTPFIDANLSFAKQADSVLIKVQWVGNAADNSVALMLNQGSVEAFSREGCWAACHSDMPGMTRDRGQQLSKYLRVAQKQQPVVGSQTLFHDAATLGQMKDDGQFVELWRANLADGAVQSVESFQILAKREAVDSTAITATGQFAKGKWTVSFKVPNKHLQQSLLAGKIITLGVAVHGDGEHGAQHKVSLPVTVSLSGDDTDFVVR
ncbi:NapC/NirT family cytochrome c [Neiella sp. HB171785]|uniref:NapC/NirT family cytochrome c n=1 Tax=Neiella litorisoli TaxID=2771431 RepID=A0A8J6QKZ9_9GAMM|nr:cytochrome c3 family protein [Neiella litorisoli]MBD1390266.1 NapC/NirT family cytochrome c [Neiella litorisoli]